MKQKKLKLTPEEERLILEKRKQKELEEMLAKPVKFGFLKEDLFSIENGDALHEYGWYFPRSTKNKIVEELFELRLKAGSKFECYFDKDRNEEWRNDNWEEIMNGEFADDYLINIQDIK